MAWDSFAPGFSTQRRWLAALACLAAMGVAGAGGAAEPSRDAKQEAKARFVAGQSHYNLNEFTEALREFKEAYRLYPDPVFLYNLGQCERQLEHHEEAIRFYRSFLREQPKAPNRQEVVRKIEEMEAALKAKEAAPDRPPLTPAPALEPAAAKVAPPAPLALPPTTPSVIAEPVPAPPSPAPTAALPIGAPPVGAEAAAPPALSASPQSIDLSTPSAPEPEASKPPIYKKWWFWTAAAAVAVGAGVGIYAGTAGDGPSAPSSELGSRKVF